MELINYKTGIFVRKIKTPDTGVHVGDQLLNINGITVAGMKPQEIYNIINRIDIMESINTNIKSRPYGKIHQLHKDLTGNIIGVTLKNKKITNIIRDTSCARNGVLIDHYIVNVDGKDVTSYNNTQLIEYIKMRSNIVTIIVYPDNFYKALKL